MIEISSVDGLRHMRSKLANLPVVAARIAVRGAEAFSELSLRTFDAEETVGGKPWAIGADGKRPALKRSGRMRAQATRFRAVGSRIMASVGSVPYARYQLKRGFLPRSLPAPWAQKLRDIADDELAKFFGGAS